MGSNTDSPSIYIQKNQFRDAGGSRRTLNLYVLGLKILCSMDVIFQIEQMFVESLLNMHPVEADSFIPLTGHR